ncbi:hypothetical protein [Rhizobium leguminosarum]|uniref:hypothetical protein n=1 Tax=Rhizobium leguminosarum TaxID=384 RepID=UPI001C90DFEC|nr:hypothetical protein [Rhizobium leguminosarum]MBY2919734.1 hypothetical protein [Rhizobium leguminosarum]MBY2975428.1 hypothetical protein [Rhizobium leguminosarum]MBY2977670.1 hypothetical protein [Rhizobium leguminosarum]MBY3006220.1 hypothetical protein [Rhizobium leguminosarum]
MDKEQIERLRKSAIAEIDEDAQYLRKLEAAATGIMNVDPRSTATNLIEDIIKSILRRRVRRQREINSYDEMLKHENNSSRLSADTRNA